MTIDAESPEPRGTLYEQAVERCRKLGEERSDPSRCSFCKGTGIAYWGLSNPPTPVMCQPCGGTGQGTRGGRVLKVQELIEELKEYPGDFEVFITGETYSQFLEIDGVLKEGPDGESNRRVVLDVPL